jgi:dCMP deaminase
VSYENFSRFGAKWDLRFLQLAATVATWSRDPSTKVGAVIVRRDKTIMSLGFNGFPRGIDDDPQLYENREYKYAHVVHAELNAILSAPVKPKDCTLYVDPFPPCSECTKAIIQSGIDLVVTWEPQKGEAMERWAQSFERSRVMLTAAGIGLCKISRSLRTNVIDTDAVFAAYTAGQR